MPDLIILGRKIGKCRHSVQVTESAYTIIGFEPAAGYAGPMRDLLNCDLVRGKIWGIDTDAPYISDGSFDLIDAIQGCGRVVDA